MQADLYLAGSVRFGVMRHPQRFCLIVCESLPHFRRRQGGGSSPDRWPPACGSPICVAASFWLPGGSKPLTSPDDFPNGSQRKTGNPAVTRRPVRRAVRGSRCHGRVAFTTTSGLASVEITIQSLRLEEGGNPAGRFEPHLGDAERARTTP